MDVACSLAEMMRAMLLFLSHQSGADDSAAASYAAHPLHIAGAVIGGGKPLDDMAQYLSA
jgi:hypothetical protein|eukprot:COSAG01_NODE_4170_length_5272_cov_1.762126_5_plen_60_part_00